MLCLKGFELYSRWVPLTNAGGQTWGCFDLHYLCLYLDIAYRYI